jgi:hypothetical protein
MKALQAYYGEKTPAVWTETFARLVHLYLQRGNKRRALARASAENKLVAPYEGRRWCDATEREVIAHIMTNHGYL